MKKLVLTIFLFGIFGSSVLAQTESDKASSGSVYSKIGTGYPVEMGNTASQSMGLLGVSFNDPFVGNLANPAHWGRNIYGLGTGSIGLRSYNASDGTNSVTNSNFSINEFQLQLPIIRGELGISGSFSPVTEASFHTVNVSQQIFGDGAAQDTLNYTLENNGSGGINRAELGVGWKITPAISVGYAPSLLFMSHDDEFEATFQNLSYAPVNFAIETSGSGLAHRFGTSIQLINVFKKDDQFGFGATVDLPATIDSEQKETGTIGNGVQNLTSELPNSEGSIKLPLKVSGGVSYSPSNLLMVGAEGFYQGWSNYQNDLRPSEEDLFVDQYKLGLGMQYFPYVTGSDKFLSYFKYRVGASYDTGHLRVEGERINTLKFSFGLGLRSPSSNSSIDLSFEYGIRGTESMNLAKEHIWGMRLSLNLAELMFFRPKLK